MSTKTTESPTELPTTVVPVWAIVDYDTQHAIGYSAVSLRYGLVWPNGQTSCTEQLFRVKNDDHAQRQWELFNEWQFTPCLYPEVDEDLQEQLRKHQEGVAWQQAETAKVYSDAV